MSTKEHHKIYLITFNYIAFACLQAPFKVYRSMEKSPRTPDPAIKCTSAPAKNDVTTANCQLPIQRPQQQHPVPTTTTSFC
jgi:hypothetical protein